MKISENAWFPDVLGGIEIEYFLEVDQLLHYEKM